MESNEETIIYDDSEILSLDSKKTIAVSCNTFDSRITKGILKEYPSNLIKKTDIDMFLVYEDDTIEVNEYSIYTTMGIQVNLYRLFGLKLDDGSKIINHLDIEPLTKFPNILLPLRDRRVIDLKELEEKDKSRGLYNHLCLVKEHYSDINLKEIADFINVYVFDYPLPQKELDDIINKVNSLDLKNRDLNDIYKTFDSFDEKETKWLYYPYIPLGSITILAGDPGCGKSNLSVSFASIISNGEKFPFEVDGKDIERVPSTVIMQNGEDGIEDVIKPRLSRAGANHENIGLIVEDKELFTLSDLGKLESVLENKRPKLIIFDPVQRYMGNVNPNSLIECTNMLKGVNKLAQKYSCSILLVMHLNKSNSSGIYKLNGSVGLPGTARSVLLIRELKDSDEKALIHIKSNLAKKGKAIVFEITDNGVEYKKQVYPSELSVSGEKEAKTSPKDIAKDFIKEILKNGAVESQTVIDTATNEKDIAKATLERAKSELPVKSFQKGGKWFWKFVDDEAVSNNHISVDVDMEI